ncbi:hemerythrin domain-containing protein [Azospirillum picis]|uniref:Hemerythrin-like domain-containing protein n=1 Tax=Azospirillum picis TaxID=488438 RepID=A0ABU0MN33_9PROT|nr:hemerythrin domain-containing protein [Azospirillum picis]MBP2301158.1 hypothetical protein [Azospirillum picis]MDQ0534880.1 hypothetical protein [Azospirillum picis]
MHTDSLTGQILHDDHHRVLALLDGLEAFIGRYGEDTLPPPPCGEDRIRLAALAEELDSGPIGGLERHFAVEEALFPALAAAGGHELTADLLADHAHILPIARRLGRLCRLGLRDGFDAELWPVFRGFADELVRSLPLHIQKEETTLLPATDALLTSQDDRLLAGAMTTTAA